ncbi:MAG: enoyl-CoA hydratase/isomerase family protein [Bacteriovoracaceae bacterium]|jgi:enoyl-CoA hydratase/carnithine racemase|nr:enoyl-CoA hydratase/isomerase family protein [Bacteriovoracaceae bacterium]
MSPLFNYRTLNTRLDKKTKSLNIKLNFLEGEEFYTNEMISELDQLFNWLAGHLEIQSVIFSSITSHFSRGINLKSFTVPGEDDKDLIEKINSAFSKLRSFNRAMMLLPQVFIIDYSMGAQASGFEFGIGADLRLANKNCKMSLCTLDRGLLPMSGGISLLELQVGPNYAKKWNLLPQVSKKDLQLTGYISTFYEDSTELEEMITNLAKLSPTARIQAKGCMIQGQLDQIEKVFNAESNYGLPLLLMNDWKNTKDTNDFQSVTEIANSLTEYKSEIYQEL